MKRGQPPAPRADPPDPSSTLAPALAADMARMFRQLGIESFRASVVDLGSMLFQAAWTITDNGEVNHHNRERPLDSQFPGAMAIVAQLAHAAAETIVVKRLSPRRWTFAWRIDQVHVVIAEARYRDMRPSVNHTDTALVRLVCDTGIRAGQVQTAGSGTDPADGALVWPATQERRRRPPSPLAKRLSLGLTLVAGLMALWMALVALPEARDAAAAAQGTATQWRQVADATMSRSLSAAMNSGDLGQLQADLSQFEVLGYFQGAAVVNARGRVVALAGATETLRIGGEVPPGVASSARGIDLAPGTERQGRLLLLKSPLPEPLASRIDPIRIAALAAFASAAVAAVLMLLRQRRSRRIGD